MAQGWDRGCGCAWGMPSMVPEAHDGMFGGLGSDPIAAETCCVTLPRSLSFSGPCVLFCDSGMGGISQDKLCWMRSPEG